MKRLRRRDLFASVLLSACACGLERFAAAQTPYGKQAMTPLEKWKVSDPPRFPSDEWYAANQSESAYQVFLQAGHVAVRLLDKRKQERANLPFDSVLEEDKNNIPLSHYADRKAVQVSNGWIISADAGEWGGRVDWFSPDGTQHYKISDDQIIGYAQTPEGLFAIQGLAHLTLRIGTFLRFEQDTSGKWLAKTIIDLRDAPYVLLPERKGAFLIITREKLVQLSVTNKTLTPLVENAFWDGLSPNSLITAPNGDFYIGMRSGVARVEKTSGTYTVCWLTPPA